MARRFWPDYAAYRLRRLPLEPVGLIQAWVLPNKQNEIGQSASLILTCQTLNVHQCRI